jgi:ABC-type nitrate/sulfonate/bicarbonate transport system permease component
LTGAAIASFLGIACAFALAQSDIWRRIFDPYFTVLNGLPRVALFLLWFGIGPMSKITLAPVGAYRPRGFLRQQHGEPRHRT